VSENDRSAEEPDGLRSHGATSAAEAALKGGPAEAAFKASDAMFRSLMTASPDAVMAVDGTGKIVLANERFRTMYGYEPEELIGKYPSMLIPARALEDNARRARKAFDEGADAGAGTVQNLEGLRRDGTEFPVEASLSQFVTDDGPMVIIAIRDTSERKAIEGQLRQAQKMEAIGNLTGGLAHDFNNLLSVVIGNIDLLKEQLVELPSAEALANEALAAALRGAELTKSLLAFARRQPLQPKLTDVNELVAGITKLLARTMGDNFEIQHHLGGDVWPVTIDQAQLESCLVNLAANARDAMPTGGELIVRTDNRHLDEDYVSLHPGVSAGDYTLIEVTDTGTGIPKAIVDTIFDPFFTTKPQGRGTGLGLSMVFGFMKQSEGHINVYSEEGAGTTFRLYLPRSAGAIAAREDQITTPAAGGLETVLAVEDNPGLRSLVVKQLGQLGYRCVEAEDGPSALKVLENEKIDLLFTDVVMPGGMSGYDLGRSALLRWPNIKVLLTSGFPEERFNGKRRPPRNMRLLIKPYRKDDLARVIREVLGE
jgi:PAS domain S-box-containing protein